MIHQKIWVQVFFAYSQNAKHAVFVSRGKPEYYNYSIINFVFSFIDEIFNKQEPTSRKKNKVLLPLKEWCSAYYGG